MIVILIVVNFLISVFNSWAVGYSWTESKHVGGWPRFMSWMGATMASVGFSWCYLVILAFVAGPAGFDKLPEKYVLAMFDLGYLALVVPLLGSGLAIMVDSWAYFWRRRTWGSGAVAGYNTFANVYNIYEAAKYIPSAWDNVSDLLFPKKKSSKSDSGLAGLAITLAILALVGGVLTASAIIRTVAERTASDRRFKYEVARG